MDFEHKGDGLKKIVFNYDVQLAKIGQFELEEIQSTLKHEIKKIQARLPLGYSSDYASLHVPGDRESVAVIQNLIEIKKRLEPTILVVIGIGGSALGTIAIHKALHGVFYNEQTQGMKVYFADTIDADYIGQIYALVKKELQQGGNVLVNVVTKSGTTMETIANFELFLALLKEYKQKAYKDYIVVTTDSGSALWKYAQKERVSCLGLPAKVGGRYSVFSPVGLFPLGMLDIDIKKLLQGARSMVQACMQEDIKENIAAISAAILYQCYKNGFFIYDTFIFSKDLFALGLWYRQLMAESLGKKFDRSGKMVHVGITPTVSVGTTDLHSVVQLYLGGPMDKVTTFVIAPPKKDIMMPQIDAFEQFVANMQGRSVFYIMDAVKKGVETAYKKNKRPFVSVFIPKIDEFYIGQLLQWKMLEVMFLGCLFNVNPFDQPQVELYKKETKEILAHE